MLNADVKVAFEQSPANVVKLSGAVTASKVKLFDKPVNQPGWELLAFEQLRISIDDVRPLAQSVKLVSVELTNPALSITRRRAGRLNLLPVAEAGNSGAIKSGAACARIQGATGKNDTQKEAKTTQKTVSATQNPWKVDIASVAVRGGSVTRLDETLAQPALINLGAVTLDASKIAVPFASCKPWPCSAA